MLEPMDASREAGGESMPGLGEQPALPDELPRDWQAAAGDAEEDHGDGITPYPAGREPAVGRETCRRPSSGASGAPV
jgi:hypothetical protein